MLARLMPCTQPPSRPPTPMLRVLCRSAAQVHAALRCAWLEEVIVDFLEVHGLKDAVNAVQAAGRRCIVATPRVLKPDEQRLWRFYLGLHADALLIRSAGMLMALLELGGPGAHVDDLHATIPALEGDFSLNAANALTADYLLSTGLTRLAPTHDCNAAQIAGMASRLGRDAARVEVILHQHLPIFHTEHCVFARFLSDVRTAWWLSIACVGGQPLFGVTFVVSSAAQCCCGCCVRRLSVCLYTCSCRDRATKTAATPVSAMPCTCAMGSHRTTSCWLTWAAATPCSTRRCAGFSRDMTCVASH